MKHLFLIIAAVGAMINVRAQSYTLSGNEVKIEGEIRFEEGTSKLLPASDIALASIQKYLADKPSISTLRIEGHVAGAGEKNQSLSEDRAKAVCMALAAKGVDCRRLLPVGFGDTKPVSGQDKFLNNRIVFSNAALRGHPIGGMALDGGGKPAGEPCQ